MTNSPRISAILLAAGRSRRLGRNKLLLPLGGESVIRRTAKALLESRVFEVVLVTGHEAQGIREAVDGLPVRLAHNPDYAQGQSTSVIAGLNAASPDAGAYLFAPGDQPLLTPRIVDELIGLYGRAQPNALAAAPRFGGRRGSPAIIDAGLKSELLETSGDEGGRRILKRLEAESPEKIVFLDLADDGIFLDIDTGEDYERARRRFPAPREKNR